MLVSRFSPLLLLFSATLLHAQQVPTAPATLAAPKEQIALRSGRVFVCKVDQGCTQQMIDGHKMLTIEADGYRVAATIAEDARYSHADVTIVNNSGNSVQVIPSDFRMEVTLPRLQRLSYVDPDHVPVAKTHIAAPEPQLRVESELGHGLPPPSYWGSQQAAEDKQDKQDRLQEAQRRKEQAAIQQQARSSGAPLLKAGPLAPAASASGRVYFRRVKKDTDMSLLVPISGTTFEFPYAAPPTTKKGKKNAPAKI